MKLNKRIEQVKISVTFAMNAKAAELRAKGVSVINFVVGEPDYDTPNSIKRKAHEAIDAGKTKYTPVTGVIELRKAICNKFLRENELEYKPEEIIASAGAKQVLFSGFFATLNEGDEVIIPAPYWVSYPDIVVLAGGIPIIVECGNKNDFKITPQQLQNAITSKTKWLLLNSPSNPTGMVYSKDELIALGEVLKKHPHVLIMSDDIYEHMVYDEKKFYTIAQVVPELKNRTLVVNGVSKSYSMTGWRLGYGAGPVELIKAMGVVQSQSTSHPSSISQYAVIDALNGEQDFLEPNRKMFENRRNLFLNLLEDIPGINVIKPSGAFYLWVDCSEVISKLKNSDDFCMYLLEEGHVVTTPGSAFGNDNYLRFSYTTSEKDIIEGCKRIKEICEKLL